MFFYGNDPYDYLYNQLNKYTAKSLKEATSSIGGSTKILSNILNFLYRLIKDKGTANGVKEEILQTLSVDVVSHLIGATQFTPDFLVSTSVFLSMRLRENHPEVINVLREALKKEKFLYNNQTFENCQSYYYYTICYNHQKENSECIQDPDFVKFQLCEAINPQFSTNEALLIKCFWAGGIYYEIKNYICRTKEVDQDLLDFIQVSIPYFTPQFNSFFADSILNAINSFAIKGITYYTLPLYRVLLLFDLDTKNQFEDAYFATILETLESSFLEKGKDEILFLYKKPVISDSEIQKISEIFETLITNYRNEYSTVIELISVFLNSKQILSISQALYEKIKKNIPLCLTLFKYIEPLFSATIIDDTYSRGDFTSDTADFIIKLLKCDRYESTNLDSIFLDLLKLGNSKYFKLIKQFSNQEKYKEPIFNSLKNYILESNISTKDIDEICSLLNDFNISEQNDSQTIEKLSSFVQNSLDSIKILPLYRDYKFLVINDLPSFVDFSPHNSLFYSILIEKDLSNFDEVIDDIICFDDGGDVENDGSNCKSYLEFLINTFTKTKETKCLLKLLDVIDLNNYSNDITSNEEIQALSIFSQYLQNAENKIELVKTIVNILQNDKQNLNLKNFLIRIPQLKEFINFSNPEEINSIVSSLTLNDDSLAFIASIGGTVSEEQLDSLFNSSDNFYPKFVVASLFPATLEKFTDEQLLDCYHFGCIIKNYKLCEALIESVSSQINQESGSFGVCIFDTSSKIAELTINALPELEIFYDPQQIQEFLVNLYSSQEQDNFDIVFSAFVNKLKKGDHEICKIVWNTYFNNDFPPFYRNDKNNYELFKFISTSTSAFKELISSVLNTGYSLYRPAISLSLYQSFSNIPKIFDQIGQQPALRVFYKLLFSCDEKVYGNYINKSVNDFVKYMSISEKELQSISFNNKGQFFSDTFQSIEPKESVLESLKQSRNSFIFMKSPEILLIQLEGKVSPDFIVNEELDLSPYSLNTSYYVLRSVGCESNIAYLKIGKNKYYKCTQKAVTCIDKIDSNDINLIIYEKISITDRYSQNKYLNQFWHSEIAESTQVNNDINRAILRSLQSESIDWSLFEKNNEFFETAVSLIKLGVKNVFRALSTSPEFSEMFLGGDELGDLIEDPSFVNKYKDEIIKLAKIFPGTPQCIFWNISDHLNINNIELYFELLYSFNVMIDYFTNRLEIINIMNDELINTPQFEKFFDETINMPDSDHEMINKEIQDQRALIPLMLKYSKDNFHLYSKLIDKNQFASIVENFEPKFVIHVLDTCIDKRSEFLPIAMKKLKETPEFQEYIKNMSQNDVTLDEIKSIFLAGDNELATELLESKYPPKTTIKQDEIKNMFISILTRSMNNENLYLSICKLINRYYQVFDRDPQITEIITEFVFKSREKIDKFVADFTILINKLPPIKWNKVLDFYKNLFPLKSYDSFFNPFYKENISLFLLNLASKSIRSYPGYIYEKQKENDGITNILGNVLKYINNKEEFVNVTISSFKHCINNPEAFSTYLKDVTNFPYIFLKMLELSADCDYWATQFGLIFIKFTILLISWIHSGEIPSWCCFYLHNDGTNSQINQVSISIMEFLTKQLQKTFLDPNVNINFNYADQSCISIVLDDLDRISIEKLNDRIKESFFKLLETIAYIYPLYTEQIVNYFIKTKSKVNMYKRINNPEVKMAYTKFILNIFREIVGDREFVQSVNDTRFKNAIILLKSQFMCLLLTKDFTYEQISPYIMIFMAFFKLKNQEIVRAFADKLKSFPFVLYILYTKDIKINNVDNSTKINLFVMNFLSKVGLENPNPGIIINFIKSLDADDPQLKEKVALLNCVLKSKAIIPCSKEIVEHCFNEFEKIALKRIDVPKVKDIFDSFIIKLGLDY